MSRSCSNTLLTWLCECVSVVLMNCVIWMPHKIGKTWGLNTCSMYRRTVTIWPRYSPIFWNTTSSTLYFRAFTLQIIVLEPNYTSLSLTHTSILTPYATEMHYWQRKVWLSTADNASPFSAESSGAQKYCDVSFAVQYSIGCIQSPFAFAAHVLLQPNCYSAIYLRSLINSLIPTTTICWGNKSRIQYISNAVIEICINSSR